MHFLCCGVPYQHVNVAHSQIYILLATTMGACSMSVQKMHVRPRMHVSTQHVLALPTSLAYFAQKGRSRDDPVNNLMPKLNFHKEKSVVGGVWQTLSHRLDTRNAIIMIIILVVMTIIGASQPASSWCPPLQPHVSETRARLASRHHHHMMG